ncbi:hypothetical protein N9Y92_03215 [Chlamydiales bacterium]|nr:hypothetical protein [Chlamydiales bacterium]
MIRFIANFFFFGLLFFLIYLYLPEAFETLVTWAHNVWNWLLGLINPPETTS